MITILEIFNITKVQQLLEQEGIKLSKKQIKDWLSGNDENVMWNMVYMIKEDLESGLIK